MDPDGDDFTRMVQSLDQLDATLRQIEEWALPQRDRMVAQGWAQETAERLAMERVYLMQSLVISAGRP